ncbi:hypothetical protein D3C72_1584520 [compost metagenome]
MGCVVNCCQAERTLPTIGARYCAEISATPNDGACALPLPLRCSKRPPLLGTIHWLIGHSHGPMLSRRLTANSSRRKGSKNGTTRCAFCSATRQRCARCSATTVSGDGLLSQPQIRRFPPMCSASATFTVMRRKSSSSVCPAFARVISLGQAERSCVRSARNTGSTASVANRASKLSGCKA